jgi:hypothetical protein
MPQAMFVLVTATIAPVTATIVPVTATTHVPVTATIAMNKLKLKLSICNEFRKNKATSTSGAYIH